MWSDFCTPCVSFSTHSQVLITIYWLGRKAHLDAFYSGPQLNFKAFEVKQVLDEGSNVYVKDSCYPEREECLRLRPSSKTENSVDSIDSLDPRALQPNSEGTFICSFYIIFCFTLVFDAV